ncbi:DUF1307 domain-containing protein [Gemella cuniculi]|uniref:DUF1307 domain-containing protein n=1 Tax=Gemella cuniculi TaxID=150240 RepID=UPI000421A0B6|nr:DUF1307 domain-containing protein [Gemella cuniculi]
MKKILKLCGILFVSIFILTACTNKKTETETVEKTKVYTEKIGQQENEVTIYYKGDTVNKITSTYTLNDLGDNTKFSLDLIKKSLVSESEKIQGLTYDAEEKDGKIVLKKELDYTKIDYDKDKEKLKLTASSFDEEKKLSYIEKKLADSGAQEKN